MSRVVVVEKNKDGKIELTKEQLQKMLDDAYNQGYSDCNSARYKYETITYPTVSKDWKITCTSNGAKPEKEWLAYANTTETKE